MAATRRSVVRSRSARASPSSYLHYWQHGIARNRVASRRVLSVLGNPVGSLTHPWLVEKTRATIAKPHAEGRGPLFLSLSLSLSVVSHGRFTSLFLRLSSPLLLSEDPRPNGTDRDQLHRSYCARGVAHRATC